MYSKKNLRYVVCVPDGQGGTIFQTSNKLPRGVSLDLRAGNWSFDGGLFTIGHGLRVTDDDEFLFGPVFVYDSTVEEECRARQQLINDKIEYNRAVTV